MIFINFKTYPQGTGDRAIKLAKICQSVSQKTKIPIIPCVQAVDLSAVAQKVKIPVWAQYLDPAVPGKKTGFVTAFAVKNAGGKGTLVNHSEHPVNFKDLKEIIILAKKNTLATMVLVADIKLASEVDKLRPDYIGLEEPSLISTKTAMADLPQPKQKIIDFVKVIKNSQPLVGAGINSEEDIINSLKLGVRGVLVSSAIVLASDPEKTLSQMAKAFVSK